MHDLSKTTCDFVTVSYPFMTFKRVLLHFGINFELCALYTEQCFHTLHCFPVFRECHSTLTSKSVNSNNSWLTLDLTSPGCTKETSHNEKPSIETIQHHHFLPTIHTYKTYIICPDHLFPSL